MSSRVIDRMCGFLIDNRITIRTDDFTERHFRVNDFYIFLLPYERLQLWVFKTRVAENRRHFRIDLTDNIQKHRRVFPTAEANVHFSVEVLIPFDDAGLRDHDLSIKRQFLKLSKPLCIMDYFVTRRSNTPYFVHLCMFHRK